MDSTLKKTLNILGAIGASILSVILVIALIVTPAALSALSLMNPDKIIDTVAGALTQSLVPTEDSTAAEFHISQLSVTTVVPGEEDVSNAAGEAGGSILEGVLGDEVSPEMIQQILDSNVAKEFVKMYTDGIANAFTGGATGKRFDETTVKEFVNENVDEIASLARQLVPELSQEEEKELKDAILNAVDENAEDFFSALPKPEEIKNQIMEQTPELAVVFQIFSQRKVIKAIIVAALILLSGLIFLCRLPGVRGFRWLAVDLFVGGGFCGLQSGALLVGSSAIQAMLVTQPALTGTVGNLVSAFTRGVAVRTGIMLVSGVVLLLAYIWISKAWEKKRLTIAEQVAFSAQEEV